MRDFLKIPEYHVVQATLPLVATLDCKAHGVCFSHFWQLPPKVREAIVGYQGASPKAEVSRFEVYQDGKNDGNLLVLAFSFDDIVGEDIECLGQYLPLTDALVRQPRPVSMEMLEKMQEISKERWSLKKAFRTCRLSWWHVAFGLIALAGWGEGALYPEHLLATWAGLAFASVVGLLIPFIRLVEEWSGFLGRRSEIAKDLGSYLHNIPQGIPAD
jgi:hypothetical protein